MPIPILSQSAAALPFIQEGRIVAVPTGTSYGLAADALQGNALQRLRNLKQRPQEKTFTICIAASYWPQYLNVTSAEKEFLESHVNQPITLLVKPKPPLRHLTRNGRIGLRVIDHPLLAELANIAGTPLTATSANISGQPPCQTVECVEQSFPSVINPESTAYGGSIEPAGNTTYNLSLAAILDGGSLPDSQPSTIIQLKQGQPSIIRRGAFQLPK